MKIYFAVSNVGGHDHTKFPFEHNTLFSFYYDKKNITNLKESIKNFKKVLKET